MSVVDYIVRRRHTEGNRRTIDVEVAGQLYSFYVSPSKRVRIPFKPAGTYGWRYSAVIRDRTGKAVWYGKHVSKSLGVRRALVLAGILTGN